MRQTYSEMSTELQIQANRENAKLSTGPLTPETKAISSLNALKTGLTGRTILLPEDDLAAYQQHVLRFETEHEPATDAEKHEVQCIADTEWRLLRIPILEAGIYAMGRVKYADLFTTEANLTLRKAMIDTHIFQNHRKELSNIHLQEMRLNRQSQRHIEQLAKLQSDRTAIDRDRLKHVFEAYKTAITIREPFDREKFGFEFSDEFLQARFWYCHRNGPHKAAEFDRSWKLQQLKKAA